MNTPAPVVIQRADYQPPAWQIPATELWFDLHPTATRVRSRLQLQRQRNEPLVLDGVNLALLSIEVDGQPWPVEWYRLSSTHLTLTDLPSVCELALECRIDPSANTALEGLYRSSGTYCTQCEAEGFRKITWFIDRPDVLSVFTVNIRTDAPECTVLLSNGNFVEGNAGPGATPVADAPAHAPAALPRTARWHDPHPKPSYLFALVGGHLACLEERFVTASGRTVSLSIHVEPHNLALCGFAMRALKQAMRWDEALYGLEYDLDRFMIVAVDDFNMGAMENKGLNIFNSKFVLASPETATDNDYMGVESVIAHEYFHNWTGNRVTCRDWFQLSLKEGLTVFRDQCFTADLHSAAVKRIDDVTLLRARQFAEDAGPMAHPIRPDSYLEINNFYTLTIYEKGAEVIRMLHTLLGEARWQSGMREYFRRHDGQAATCEDFIRAMEAAGDIDLTQFRRWYEQAGTPRVQVSDAYDAATGCYSLKLSQSCPDTPGQSQKPPLHIPLRFGLLSGAGKILPLQPTDHRPDRYVSPSAGLDDAAATSASDGGAAERAVGTQDNQAGSVLLELTQAQHVIRIEGLAERPVPSLLRGFSAPVIVKYAYEASALALLMEHDPDPFNRWDAAQRLATEVIGQRLAGRVEPLAHEFVDAYARVLLEARAHLPPIASADSRSSPIAHPDTGVLYEAAAESTRVAVPELAFVAEMLSLPSLDTLAEVQERIDMPALFEARNWVQRSLAEALFDPLMACIVAPAPVPPADFPLHPALLGHRRLANRALSLLALLDVERWQGLAEQRYAEADNMTDRLAALATLCLGNEQTAVAALDAFLDRYADQPLLVDKWFAVQAGIAQACTLNRVQALLEHPLFNLKNPNRVRSLLGAFAMNNPVALHAPDGQGYALLADQVLVLNALNPQLAARLASALTGWRRHAEPFATLMQAQWQRIASSPALSPDVFELAERALAEPVD